MHATGVSPDREPCPFLSGSYAGVRSSPVCDVPQIPDACALQYGGCFTLQAAVEGMTVHAMVCLSTRGEPRWTTEAMAAYDDATSDAFLTCADNKPSPLDLAAVATCMMNQYAAAGVAPPRGFAFAPELLIDYAAPEGHLLIPFGVQSEDSDDPDGVPLKGVNLYTVDEHGNEVRDGPTLFLVVLPPRLPVQ